MEDDRAVSRYRIEFNGQRFRVAKQRRFLWWSWWDCALWYFCTGNPVNFSTYAEAESALDRWFLAPQRAREHGWQPTERIVE